MILLKNIVSAFVQKNMLCIITFIIIQLGEQEAYKTHFADTEPRVAPDRDIPEHPPRGGQVQDPGDHCVGLRQVQGQRLPGGGRHRSGW